MAKPAPVREPSEEELDEGRMPFLEHLRELRIRLRNAVIFFIVGFGACWYWAKDIFLWLKVPLDNAWHHHKAELGEMPRLNFGSLVEPFWVDMSMALWAGLFVSSPFTFYQLWKFIAPGLYKKERNTGIIFAVSSAFFFIAGAAFCYYYVLERLFVFLLGYADQDLQPMLLMREYIDLTRTMMIAFGGVFELPVLIYFLAKIGLVTHRGLWRFNRWFIVIAFIIGAVLTPSPDPITQTMMALPMVVLYNLSIIVAWVVVRNRERATAD